jgi:hypothetical protein
MRLLVCGGRDYDDDDRVFSVLNSYDRDHDFTALIEGGAKGADSAARRWAAFGNLPVQTYRADWKKHGKAAGPIRNERMIVEGKPDLVIAFPGGRGTRNMIETATLHGVPVIEVSP